MQQIVRAGVSREINLRRNIVFLSETMRLNYEDHLFERSKYCVCREFDLDVLPIIPGKT